MFIKDEWPARAIIMTGRDELQRRVEELHVRVTVDKILKGLVLDNGI